MSDAYVAGTGGTPPVLNADQFIVTGRRRVQRLTFWGLLLALACGGAFIALDLDSALLPLVLLITIATPVLVWRFPRTALYVTFAAVCLFELFPTEYADALTDRVPFFWNVNTIFQRYAGANVKGIPLNLCEVFLLTAGFCSLVRAVFTNSVSLRAGTLFWPIAVYIGFVALGWINGMATGGDFKISLQEVRSQVYFLLAYLMAVNLVRDRRQVDTLLWTFVVCVGLKGVLYTFRRYVTLGGQPLPDQGVGSHEEAFFFNAFVMLLLVLGLTGADAHKYKWLRRVMWTFLPFVVTGNLATNRRAGTAALIITMPILLLAAHRALPHRRKLIAGVGLSLLAGFAVYYPAFRNSDSLFAQPARAIRSQFQPNERDASSNAYRDAENANLMATIQSAPIQGYGYGKRMFHTYAIADISQLYEWWDIIPHNQILWIWMRVGTFGFVAFWTMMAAFIVHAGSTIQDARADAQTKAVGMFCLVSVTMLIVFGVLDLQLSSFRNMLFVGLWAGALSSRHMALSSVPNRQD